MKPEELTVCRLCLRICNSGFQLIKDTTEETLNFLLINFDIGISHEPVLCNKCADNLKRWLDFKAHYLSEKDYTIKEEDVKPKVRNTCPNGAVGVTDTTANDSNICYFCMKQTIADFAMLLKDHVVVILGKYFPELVLSITEDSIVCMPCYESLQQHIHFISKSLDIEEKINEYCKVEGTNNQGQVDLKDVLIFAAKNVSLKYDQNTCSVETLEKHENIDFEIKSEDYNIETGAQDVNFNIDDDKIKVEENGSNRCQDNKTAEIKRFQCTICVYQSDHRGNFKNHMLVHTNDSEIPKYNCDACDYKAKRKGHLQRHTLTHKGASETTMYRCELCAFQTKYRYSIPLHMLTHKSASELTMYSCTACTYQTKQKVNLQGHMLTHKSSFEVTMFKCKECTYETKRKVCLSKHMLTHKSISDVTMYKCNVCTYQTKYNCNLQKHQLIHKSSTELTMHKCTVCGHQTKRKDDLQKHMLVHKSTSEVTLVKCKLCAYQTKHRENISTHMLTHKSNSEVTMYKCKGCPFESKYKQSLAKHMLIHKSTSELTMYKCKVCTHQTKRKGDLHKHMSVHKAQLSRKTVS